MVTDQKKRVLKTTPCSWWECTLKTLLTTETPECRILPGLKEPTLVVPLTRLLGQAFSFPSLLQLRLRIDPVPVGLAEPPEDGTEEATEDEDTAAEPNYAFAKGYGRFGKGYSRLATALQRAEVAVLFAAFFSSGCS